MAFLATTGVILAAAYMLWLYKRVIFGKIKNVELKKLFDLNKIESFVLLSLAVFVLFFGFYPEPLLKTINVSITNLINNHETNIAYFLQGEINQ